MSLTKDESSGKRKRDVDRLRNKGESKVTLGSMLKYMEGYEIIAELKTGKRHRGRLLSADDNMNIILEEEEEVSTSKADATAVAMESKLSIPLTRNIRGSKIRYIHFPDNANVPILVQSGRERERNAAKKYQKTKRSSR